MTSLSVSWGLKMSGPLMRIQARYNLYDLNKNTRGDNLMKSNDFSKLKENHKTSFIRSAGGLVLYVTFRPQKHYCSVLLLHKILMIFMNFVSKISHWKIFSIWRPWWKRDWHRECVGRGNKYRKKNYFV